MTASGAGLQIPGRLRGEGHDSEEEWLESALAHVDLLRQATGRRELSEVSLLDVGCDPALVKVLLDQSRPIGHFAGVGFSSETVEWLEANVSDPSFEFHFLDAGNAWLNPDGVPLTSIETLPLGSRRFDLISAISVFTHLPPDDFATMLRLLRRHVDSAGSLLLSLPIIDAQHPPPLEEELRSKLNSGVPEVRAKAEASIEEALQSRPPVHDPRFVDWDPSEPLARAQYTEDYAVELVERTGWEVDAIHPPQRQANHSILCRPA